MGFFKKILKYAIPYKGYALLNIFFNVLYAFFSALSMIAFIPLLEVLFQNTKKTIIKPEYSEFNSLKSYIEEWLSFQVNYQLSKDVGTTLIYVVSLVIILFLLKNLFNYLALFFITYLRNGVLKDIRNALFDKIINLPVAFFTEKKKGDLMARISADVIEVQVSFLSILELLIREPLTIIFTLVAMLTISSKLTLFVIIFIPISGFFISLIGKKLRKDSDLVQKEQGNFLSIIDETINGQKVIKTFGAGNLFISKFQNSTKRFFNYSNRLLHRANLAAPSSEFFGITVIGVLLWYGGQMVLIDQTIKGSTFLVFIGLAYNILTPAKAISKSVFSIRKGDAAAARIIELLEAENALKDKVDAIAKTSLTSEIEFKNVKFSYDNQIIIPDLNLIIKKGETVALVGQSGSGKTTIANLLARFYDVQSGSISLDGLELPKLKKTSLHEMIGIVTQDSILFNDSIKNNLIIGKKGATKEEVIQAAKAANAHDFIINMEDGYESNIGESGNKLSGGQKQRISIARAILKNPQILILDEATSSLDTKSEKLVQEALEFIMKGRTAIVIAHRLSTIQKANLIVVMQNGEIVEKGSHDQLLSKKEAYYNLVQLQQI
ncbi:MAG: subfamily B ATP-binding cassette protein MsbA [Candidatus Marivariicella framensis]|jgi:subfamily B ATP-binding cassette protein MsbA|tara:strand:- start:54 stop:1874 length:1821 start_codon:yes stop_codon:yes gene_type:complete